MYAQDVLQFLPQEVYGRKMTDGSFNLDLTSNFGHDHKIRKHSRRKGWTPPPRTNVNITTESYDVIRQLALARGQRHSPFYEELSKLLEEFFETKEFLQMAVEDNKKMRQKIEEFEIEVRSKLND
jgi:hypothetical protein